VAILIVFGLLALYFLGMRRKRTGKENADGHGREKTLVSVEYSKLLKALEQKGIPRKKSETPLELCERLIIRGLPFARACLRATEAYLGVRFGGEPFAAAIQKNIREATELVKTHRPVP